jgi:hypothetical protein
VQDTEIIFGGLIILFLSLFGDRVWCKEMGLGVSWQGISWWWLILIVNLGLRNAWETCKVHFWMCLWGHFHRWLNKGKDSPQREQHHSIDWGPAWKQRRKPLVQALAFSLCFLAAMRWETVPSHTLEPRCCALPQIHSNGASWPWTKISKTISQNKSSLLFLSLKYFVIATIKIWMWNVPHRLMNWGLGCLLIILWEVMGSWSFWLNQWINPCMDP